MTLMMLAQENTPMPPKNRVMLLDYSDDENYDLIDSLKIPFSGNLATYYIHFIYSWYHFIQFTKT